MFSHRDAVGEDVSMFSWRRGSGSDPSDGAGRSQTFGHRLDRARCGESEALSWLYRQFLPGVFAYIAARVPDRVTAEDLTSEVFLKMIEGISHLRTNEEAGFAAWILQIARITVAGYYRKREHQPALVSLEAPVWDEEDEAEAYLALPSRRPEADPVHQAEAREEWGEVVKAINLLTEEQRQVLISRLVLGYDVATVAQMMGKKANAIKAVQFRALQSLYRLLERDTPARQALDARVRRQGGAV